MSDQLRVSGKKVALPSLKSGEKKKVKFQVRPGGWVIAEFEDGTRKRLMLTEVQNKLSFHIAGQLWCTEWISGSRSSSSSGPGGGDSDLMAQFPGKVRKLLVTEQSQVSEGEPLLLVEAMKMEFSIKAPFAAKVVKLLVKEGQQLSPGDRFLELEALK